MLVGLGGRDAARAAGAATIFVSEPNPNRLKLARELAPSAICIDPTKELVLNPAAWTNPPDGQFGTGAPYYNDYRYQRRPSESMSLGRVFRFQRYSVPERFQ